MFSWLVRSPQVGWIVDWMVGEISSGKSSFFNTVESVFAGHVTTRADTGTDVASITKKVTADQYRLLNNARRTLAEDIFLPCL